MVKSCWDIKPEFRPTFSQLSRKLFSVMEEFAGYYESFTLDNPHAVEMVNLSGVVPLPSVAAPEAVPLCYPEMMSCAATPPSPVLSTISDVTPPSSPDDSYVGMVASPLYSKVKTGNMF